MVVDFDVIKVALLVQVDLVEQMDALDERVELVTLVPLQVETLLERNPKRLDS